jgi:hypothetical protein
MLKLRPGVWPLLTVLGATIPVAGLFTFSKIFYVRDLTMTFSSRFLFLRHSILSGAFPLWDPYPANGQPAVGRHQQHAHGIVAGVRRRSSVPKVPRRCRLAAWGTYRPGGT